MLRDSRQLRPPGATCRELRGLRVAHAGKLVARTVQVLLTGGRWDR